MSRYPIISYAADDKQDIDTYSQIVSAPGPFMEFGETLVLDTISTVATATLRFSGKFLSPDGEIRSFTEDLTISAAGSQSSPMSRIGPCWLMGFGVALASGTVHDGEIMCTVSIGRAAASEPIRVICLASGTVSQSRSLGMGAWSGGRVASGWLSVADPAAGANISYALPAGADWLVKAVTYKFTSSATVASRSVVTQIKRGTTILLHSLQGGVVAASSVVNAHLTQWTANAEVNMGSSNFLEQIVMPPLRLIAGDIFNTIYTNLQAGDQFSNIQLLIE